MVVKVAGRETDYSFSVGSKAARSRAPVWSNWVSLASDDGILPPFALVQVSSTALNIARDANSLSAVASVPTTADILVDIRNFLAEEARAIATHKAALTRHTESLAAGRAAGERTAYIQTLVNKLVSNAEAIQSGRIPLLQALRVERVSTGELNRIYWAELAPRSVGISDDRFYNLITSAGDGSAGSSDLSKSDVLGYTHANDFNSNLELGYIWLSAASLFAEPIHVAWIQESYDSSISAMDRDIEYLRSHPSDGFGQREINLAERVIDAGRGEDNYFDRLYNRIDLLAKETLS